MKLSDLKPGQKCVITKILGHGAFRKRVMEMGFVRGHEVEVLLQAPLHDPVKYALMNYEISLRRAEAEMIEVVPILDDALSDSVVIPKPETAEHEEREHRPEQPGRTINVALIGNPNCGKTSIFNRVSGSHEHVGNYAGVTVSAKEGKIHYKGYTFNIVDLPGTYSISAYSPEEKYVMRYLREETPDVIVNVVVASNLERNLYLTTELIDMNRSMVIDLNMYDELKKSPNVLDYKLLGKMLGVPVVPTTASTGRGIDKLLDTIIKVYEMKHPDVRHIHVKMRPEVEKAMRQIIDAIKADHSIGHYAAPRFIAVKLLEEDPEMLKQIERADTHAHILEVVKNAREQLRRDLGEDINTIISDEKYGFIRGALRETFVAGEKEERRSTKVIDEIVTNKLFGFPIFLLVMWLMFWCTFTLGQYPMDWLESGVTWLSETLGRYMNPGPLKDLLLDGVIGGVGGVIVFLPNILILYAFISFMEDSGYMARVAFIMDKLMHRMGLHGKSFIPLVMGFGCNVPAIMSSRIIESRSSRLITILVNPFMSCSARIPIYVLLCGAFFPHSGTWVFFGLYILGIAVAVVTARLLRRFWFKKDETPFVMELPPYRVPTAKAVLRDMWSKARQYLQKMGGLILVASVIIWALSYFPRAEHSDVPAQYSEEVLGSMPQDYLSTLDAEQREEAVTTQYQQSNSILAHIGHFTEPVVRPLDFDWRVSVSLLTGAAAKEVVVSTLGVLYVGDDNEQALSERLRTPSPLTGEAPFSTASALAFMVFVLLYCPCVATLAAIVRETGSWRYAAFSLCYNTALAWVLAFAVYHIALLF